MGLFDFGARARAANLDSEAAVMRRNSLAAALDSARNPAPAPTRRTMPGNGMAARMMFASGDVGRLSGDWPTMPVPADWIVHRYQRTLVARSREQAHNNDFMKSFLRLNRQNIVGSTGVVFHSAACLPNGDPDHDARAAVEDAFKDWCLAENFDVTGKLSRRAMENACVETAARDGEYFLRIVTGRKHGGKYGVALQMLDPVRCPVDFDRADMDGGNYIRHGIEFTEFGRPVAYYFTDENGGRSSLAYSYGGRSYLRIPADEIIHGFVSELPGQKRGFPWAATGLFRAKQTSAMEDAAVVNARVGASKMGFIQFKEGAEGPEWDEDDDLQIDAEAGAFPVLPVGAEVKEFNPAYPMGEFAPFVKQMLRSFSAGGGVSYPSLSQDLEGVNFSSIRHGELDARETYKDRQEWLIEGLDERLFAVWLPRATLASLIVSPTTGKPYGADRMKQLQRHAWQGRRWQWIDPQADSAAAESSKNNFLTSPGRLIREQGSDPARVWAEVGADIKAMRDAGIPDEFIALSFGQKIAPAPTAKPKE